MRWYFTTRKKFLQQTCIPMAVHFHWLTQNQKQHFTFSKCSCDLFFPSFLHWQIYEQAIHHQKHCRDRNPRRKEGRGGGGVIILDLLKSDFDKCKIFQNMFSLQIQLSKVLLQSFGVFFHSFGVYIEFSTFFISSNIQLSFPPILSTRHFYRWSSSCIFAMKRLKYHV